MNEHWSRGLVPKFDWFARPLRQEWNLDPLRTPLETLTNCGSTLMFEFSPFYNSVFVLVRSRTFALPGGRSYLPGRTTIAKKTFVPLDLDRAESGTRMRGHFVPLGLSVRHHPFLLVLRTVHTLDRAPGGAGRSSVFTDWSP